MKASVVQSLLARNRKRISDLEAGYKTQKEYFEEYWEKGEDAFAYDHLNLMRWCRKEIKKLVAIQKELKKELRDIYEFERITENF
jgi:hypothetical protein